MWDLSEPIWNVLYKTFLLTFSFLLLREREGEKFLFSINLHCHGIIYLQDKIVTSVPPFTELRTVLVNNLPPADYKLDSYLLIVSCEFWMIYLRIEVNRLFELLYSVHNATFNEITYHIMPITFLFLVWQFRNSYLLS